MKDDLSEGMMKDNKTLEQVMERLNAITEKMEKETLPLDQMMALYKEGKALEKEAKEQLLKADEEIRILEAQESKSDEE